MLCKKKIIEKGVEKDELPPVTLVGNKCDLEDARVVSLADGQRTAREMGDNVGFVETSAKEGINVTKVFEDIVRNIKSSDKKPKPVAGGLLAKRDKGGRFCTLL